MELPNKLLEQRAFRTRPKVEEHMLVVLAKFTHEEHPSQPLQTNAKHIIIPFSTGYNGIFIVSNKNVNFLAKSDVDEEGFNQISIPPGA